MVTVPSLLPRATARGWCSPPAMPCSPGQAAEVAPTAFSSFTKAPKATGPGGQPHCHMRDATEDRNPWPETANGVGLPPRGIGSPDPHGLPPTRPSRPREPIFRPCTISGCEGGCLRCHKGREHNSTKDRCLFFPLEKQKPPLSLLSFFSFSSGLQEQHMEVPRLGVKLELQLRSIPQLTAMPNPRPTERDQGSDPHPHGYQLDLFPRSRGGNSIASFLCQHVSRGRTQPT